LQFATEACDYDYKMVVEANGKTNEIIILPETLARECCIKPEDLKDMNVIADCIAKFGKKMNGNDESERATVQGIVSDIVFEQAEHGNVEALEDKAVSNSYKKDILGPLIDSVTNVQDNNSGISNISVANVQMLYLLNRLRKIYTGSLIMSGLSSINSISKEAVDEEAELGLGGASDQEYAYQVTRSDGTVAINSPIIPENLARKCHFNLDSDSSVMKDCYIKVFNEQFETDKDETARAFIDSIEYQGTQDVLKKGLYQKVKSAEYEEGKMKETNEAVQDGSDAHKNKEAMLTTESEMLFALNDIINLQASRIGYNGLKTLHKLMPTEQASTGK